MHARRKQGHLLDPEARIDVTEALGQHAREVTGIARGRSGADANGLAAPIDAPEDKIEAPYAQAGAFEITAQS